MEFLIFTLIIDLLPPGCKNTYYRYFVQVELFCKCFSTSIVISGIPGTPDKPEITQVDVSFISLSWTPPSHDGGSPITGYTIEQRDTIAASWTLASRDTVTDTTFTVTDLKAGEKYEFQVAAVNNVGQGPFSEPTKPVSLKPTYSKNFISNFPWSTYILLGRIYLQFIGV